MGSQPAMTWRESVLYWQSLGPSWPITGREASFARHWKLCLTTHVSWKPVLFIHSRYLHSNSFFKRSLYFDVVLVRVLLRWQYCWDFMCTASLSCIEDIIYTPDVLIFWLITISSPFHHISRTSGVVLCYRHIPWGWELRDQSLPILRHSAVVYMCPIEKGTPWPLVPEPWV